MVKPVVGRVVLDGDLGGFAGVRLGFRFESIRTRNPSLNHAKRLNPHRGCSSFRSDSIHGSCDDGDSAPQRACWGRVRSSRSPRSFDAILRPGVVPLVLGVSAIAAPNRIGSSVGGNRPAGWLHRVKFKFKTPFPKSAVCTRPSTVGNVGNVFKPGNASTNSHRSAAGVSQLATSGAIDDHVDFRLRRFFGRSRVVFLRYGTAQPSPGGLSHRSTGQPHRYVFSGTKCMWLLSTVWSGSRWRRSMARNSRRCEFSLCECS